MNHIINMVFLYYDNPRMLGEQIACWNAYLEVFESPPTVLLIDDGSPKTCAADIVRKCDCKVPIRVYRIEQDIAWNFSGARNLGCHYANEWIYVSDIDTLLFADDALKLFGTHPLEKDHFYMPRRVWLPGLEPADPGIVNLLFHKEKYLEIGGYDEDYAGFYGKEETDFYNRLKRAAHRVNRDDVLIRVTPHTLIHDARTIGKIRDKSRNSDVYAQKEAAGFLKPVNLLRFTWRQDL